MGAITDLRGRTFGRLSISNRAEPVSRNGRAWWPCFCECGREVLVMGKRLLIPDGQPGCTRSCGCWRADPDVRQAARMKVSPRRRRQIARAGGLARMKRA
jgi:hypothetical protein